MPSQIKKLSWKHNGMRMKCEVGGPLPAYFETGSEPVLEIIDCGDHYAIKTPSRGGSGGSLVRAGRDRNTHVTYYNERGQADANGGGPGKSRILDVVHETGADQHQANFGELINQRFAALGGEIEELMIPERKDIRTPPFRENLEDSPKKP
jgi:hypothetical protein